MSDVVPADAGATPSNQSTNDAPADQGQSVAPTANIPVERIAEFNQFLENSGGFDKAWGKFKNGVTGRKADQPAEPQTPAGEQTPTTSQATTVPQTPAEPTKLAEGYLSTNDLAAMAYRDRLAAQYEGLGKEYFDKGTFMDEMNALGIQTVDAQGNLNDKSIRMFLDMKMKTLPPATPANAVTTTPTVDYVPVGEKVETYDQALAIMKQSSELSSRGIAPHPKLEEAKKIVSEHFKERANTTRR